MTNNKFVRIYLNEILYQIQCAKDSFNSQDIDEFTRHHHFLIHCSNVYKILFPTITNKDNEKEKEIKENRNKFLKEYFNNYEKLLIDSSFMKIRNHLEHFNERLDKILIDCRVNVIDKNISIGGPLPIGGIPRDCFLRNIENGKFTLLGDECQIQKLWDSISKIENYIKNNPI